MQKVQLLAPQRFFNEGSFGTISHSSIPVKTRLKICPRTFRDSKPSQTKMEMMKDTFQFQFDQIKKKQNERKEKQLSKINEVIKRASTLRSSIQLCGGELEIPEVGNYRLHKRSQSMSFKLNI